jgi:hypothetical protein
MMLRVAHVVKSRWLIYLFLPLSFFYLLIGFNRGLGIYDEGMAVCGAEFVLNGKLPYRDFYTYYGPGQFYLLAGLFKLFGPSLLVERLSLVSGVWLMSLAAYFLAEKLVGQVPALLAWVMITIIPFGNISGLPSPLPITLTLCLVSVMCLLNFFSGGRRNWLIGCGVAAGLAIIFRPDLGIYSFAVETVSILLWRFMHLSTVNDRFSLKLFSIITPAVYYLLGVAVVFLPVFCYFITMVEKQTLVELFITVPFTVYPRTRGLPYPRPANPLLILSGELSIKSYVGNMVSVAPYYFPLLVLILTAVLGVIRIYTRTIDLKSPKLWGNFAILGIGILFFNTCRFRPDFAHLPPVFVMSSILFSVLLTHLYRIIQSRPVIGMVASFICLPIVFAPLQDKALELKYFFSDKVYFFKTSRAKGIYLDLYEKGRLYEEALNYIQSHVKSNEYIFIGNSRHDLIIANDALFYFLSARRPCSRYIELDPGIVTTVRVQKEIIADIQKQNVNYVVLRRSHVFLEPNESSVSSGVTLLDDFIRDKFFQTKQFYNYTVWKKMSNSSEMEIHK